MYKRDPLCSPVHKAEWKQAFPNEFAFCLFCIFHILMLFIRAVRPPASLLFFTVLENLIKKSDWCYFNCASGPVSVLVHNYFKVIVLNLFRVIKLHTCR